MAEAYLAVVNPAAGGGRCGRRAPAAIRDLRARGVAVDVIETTGPGQATALVREAWAAGRRRFISVGGDGTGYEIVNGIFTDPAGPAPGADDSTRPRLGFLPLGTGNSFLRDFTGRGAAHSLEALVAGRTRPCDVLRLDHDGGALHFINLLSLGFVARVNAARQHRFRRLGEAGYVAAVLAELAGLAPRPFPLALDGGPRDTAPMVFCSFNNSKFTGGKMKMAPHADTADGRIAVVRVGPLGRARLLAAFPRIFTGSHIFMPDVRADQARVVEFFVDEALDMMVDGEALRERPRRMSVLPAALDVCV